MTEGLVRIFGAVITEAYDSEQSLVQVPGRGHVQVPDPRGTDMSVV